MNDLLIVLRKDVAANPKFPEPPYLTLIATFKQILSPTYSFYLLTMVKTGWYTEEVSELGRKRTREAATGKMRSPRDATKSARASRMSVDADAEL
ncbi:hypothetical protein KSP40_PGU012900 [Platanthera guangdongensis]|uniref:Uncharacterized protein n=1 Tax=Platanthera guangdongensis TaxID=2320717 RepID=A0ABR2N227_9ASPA